MRVSFRPMNDAHEEQVDDPRDKEIFIAGMSYWTSHPDLDTFNSDKLVTSDKTFVFGIFYTIDIFRKKTDKTLKKK